MIFNVDQLDEELRSCVEELRSELKFSIGAKGIALRAVPSSRFFVSVSGGIATIEYTEKCEFFLGIKYILSQKGDFAFEKKRAIRDLQVMCDCSRNSVLTVATVKKLIRLLSTMGYNGLMLYTEDTYEVTDEPYFGYMRGAFTKEELKELDAYSLRFGIELVPCIQTLAHLDGLTKWWREYYSIIDCQNILLVGNERTYKLIDNMFTTLEECFTTRRINIGMDEAWLLGAGKYLKENGYESRFEIMKKHLSIVSEIARKHGFSPAIWSDMFSRHFTGCGENANACELSMESIKESIPENVKLIYWDYYSEDEAHYEKMLDLHLQMDRDIWFAGSAFTSFRFSSGIKLSRTRLNASFNACNKKQIQTYIVTLWGDDGGECSFFSALPSLVRVAAKNYDDTAEETENAFQTLFGLSIEEFSSLDFPRDRYLLYNDCLAGVFDTSTVENYAENYDTYYENIKNAEKKAGQFSYLFTARKAYCKVMRLKYDLGVVTREIYQNGNRREILKLVKKRYNPLIKRLKVFYKAFRTQWDMEKKPYGFEVQDARLGGLLHRIEHCKERLIAYAKGEIDKIPELEINLIDWDGFKEKISRRMLLGNIEYKDAISVGFI